MMFNKNHNPRRISQSSKRLSLKTILLSSAWLLMLVGCGSGSNTTPESDAKKPETTNSSTSTTQEEGKTDVCSLLTKAEVEAALGGPVESMTPTEDMQKGQSCWYQIASESLAAPQAILMVWPTAYTMPQLQKSLQETANAGSFEPVAGIGDEAYWNNNTLYVKSGARILSIGVKLKNETPESLMKASKELAAKAIQRIR